MFERLADRVHTPPSFTAAATHDTVSARGAAAYAGPERRQRSPSELGLITAALDEIDYGLLLLGPRRRLIHANHAAITLLKSDFPLHLVGGELRSRHGHDESELVAAVSGAADRGLRRMLTLGRDPDTVSVSVVPLRDLGNALSAARSDSPAGQAVLLMLGKRPVGSSLVIDAFARRNGLSAAEARVLKALCSGLSPSAIADQHGVAMSTVRTQIGSIRAKTSEPSIRGLLRRVSELPPLQGVLRA